MGSAVVLLLAVTVSQLPGPLMSGPLNVPPTLAEAALGRELFFDARLSANGSVSCATCHDPRKGYSDGLPVAVGIFGQTGMRNSPTIINSGYMKPFAFWDGRAIEVTDQSILPISNPIEMGQQTIEQVVARLNADPRYVVRFTETFGVSGATPQRLARALACFESTLNSFNAPIDKFLAGDERALSPEARVGYRLCDEARCFECHPPPLYTDNRLHDVGFELATRGAIVDRGRGQVTRLAADVGKFKTPTLRSLAKTAPYGHNGRMPDVARVVRHFNTGGQVVVNGRQTREANCDARVKPLGWTKTQEEYVTRFLLTAFEGADYPFVFPPNK